MVDGITKDVMEDGQLEMDMEAGMGAETDMGAEASLGAEGCIEAEACVESDAARGCCCSQREKKRTGKEERDLLNRLSRIEGQIRGIKAMVEDDRYCVDILTQVSAVQAALNSFNKMLLSNHIKTCVVEDIERGNTEVVDELCRTIQKLMK